VVTWVETDASSHLKYFYIFFAVQSLCNENGALIETSGPKEKQTRVVFMLRKTSVLEKDLFLG
jgi:hypothetical protein